MTKGKRRPPRRSTRRDRPKLKERLEALLTLPWLPPSVQSAVIRELGFKPHERQRQMKRAKALALSWEIKECSQQMREAGERPRGGIYDEAVRRVAEKHEMTDGNLKQFIRRHRPRARFTTSQSISGILVPQPEKFELFFGEVKVGRTVTDEDLV
jgi:hypothetical protein